MLATSLVSAPPVFAEAAPTISFAIRKFNVALQPGTCRTVEITNPPTPTVTGDPTPTVSYLPSFPSTYTGPFVIRIFATASNGVAPNATTFFDLDPIDLENPRWESVPSEITVAATSAAGAVVSYSTPRATDNCGVTGVIRLSGPASGTVFPIGRTNVLFRAEDFDGNTTTTVLPVSVTAPPTISLPSVVTVPAGPTCTASNVRVTPTTTGYPTPSVTYDPPLAGPFAIGLTRVVATASNNLLPNGEALFDVEVVDQTEPTITVPSDITVQATSALGAVVTYGAIRASDNCSPPSISFVDGLRSGSTFPIGTTAVTYRATDAAGNAKDASFDVTVTGTAPTIEPIADITVTNAPNLCSAPVAAPSTTTTGLPTPTVSFSPTMPTQFHVGTTSVTATASNGVSPDATTTFSVQVDDNEAPRLQVPRNITQTATGANGAVVTYASPIASDNCPGVTFGRVGGLASGSVFPIGTTTVTYRADDAAGNQEEKSFTVTVLPVPPTISPIADITVNNDPDLCSATVAAPATTTTGFPTPRVLFSPTLPGSLPVGVSSVVAVAGNGAPPDATTRFTVTVKDAQAPAIRMPADITARATSPSGATVTYGSPTATDNCAGLVVARTAGPASGATFPIGTTTVTFRATDSSGNPTSGSFTVTVLGAAAQIDALITQVANTPPGSSLVSKLTEARTALAAGRVGDACRAMSSFIDLVSAQRGKKLTRQQADSFIASARQIRSALGCR